MYHNQPNVQWLVIWKAHVLLITIMVAAQSIVWHKRWWFHAVAFLFRGRKLLWFCITKLDENSLYDNYPKKKWTGNSYLLSQRKMYFVLFLNYVTIMKTPFFSLWDNQSMKIGLIFEACCLFNM